MGLLIDGVWHEQEPAKGDAAKGESAKGEAAGRFQRADTVFRNWVTPDGRPGPTGHDGFAAASGRYHLYVSLACPWAHRTLIMRALKGLDAIVPVSVTHWLMADQGWNFASGEGVVPDSLFNSRNLHEIYTRADGSYTGRVTVPVLWDSHTQTIVNNESAEITRMFGSAFDGVGAKAGDYYPADRRAEIDEINARVYDTLNNGVYKAGFATSQSAYEEAVVPLFETLDWLEERLSRSRFLVGHALTEADIRLFTTLVRFDPVYNGHFKCNLRRLVDYRNLWAYTRDIYQWPGVAPTVNFMHIKRHYYMSHRQINPSGIVPLGPTPDFEEAVERGDGVEKRIVF
ncbi:MAG: glutathione S-transferase family protein [Acetobacteraceae bacterium]|nr:glutathione S-transferase family protein [Acetobacteraceae bacterium]